MTSTGYRLIAAITALSVAHHVDHVLRGVAGWPLTDEVSPFTFSLLVYPVIAGGVLLSLSRRAGPRFWAALAGGGALFILAIHLGPAAGDSVALIPGQYTGWAASTAALVVLAAFFVLLVLHAAYEARRAIRAHGGPHGRKARSSMSSQRASTGF